MKKLGDIYKLEDNFKYSDVDIYMEIEKNDIKLVKDYASIYQSIWNILNTRKGEMPHAINFGLDLNRLIFEPNSNTESVKSYIIANIEAWEKRVKIVDVSVKSGGVDNNAIALDFIFQIGNQTVVQSYGISIEG